MGKLRLDLIGLHEYQQNRYPYLLIDVAEEVIPGKSAKGYKNLSINDWWFEVRSGPPKLDSELSYKFCIN